MSDRSTWHRIANVDPESKTGTCSQCGPGVRLYFRRSGEYWICYTKREEHDRAKHGLSITEARKLKAGRKCEVRRCNKPATDVDHCHGSNRIRGVLCSHHNSALGYAHDSIEELEDLIEYLKMTDGVDGLTRLGYAD